MPSRCTVDLVAHYPGVLLVGFQQTACSPGLLLRYEQWTCLEGSSCLCGQRRTRNGCCDHQGWCHSWHWTSKEILRAACCWHQPGKIMQGSWGQWYSSMRWFLHMAWPVFFCHTVKHASVLFQFCPLQNLTPKVVVLPGHTITCILQVCKTRNSSLITNQVMLKKAFHQSKIIFTQIVPPKSQHGQLGWVCSIRCQGMMMQNFAHKGATMRS